MKIKKILAAAAVLAMAAVCAATVGMTAFAEDDIGAVEVDNKEIRKGEGYYIAHVSYRIDPETYSEAYGDALLFGGTEGWLQEGETRESVENEITETARNEVGYLVDKYPDKYGFAVYLYFYDDYDLTPEEFFDFVNKDIAERDAASGFADNDIAEDEPEAIYDEPLGGEGYYVCHISFHDGIPDIHDENGDAYDIWVDESGYIREGETREDIENSVAEDMRNQLVSLGVNPYAFDVYVYYYDDYDLTPTEFNNFVIEDIFRRDSERDTPTANVPNPVTGAGLPCSAAGLAVLSAAGIFAVNKKKSL